MCIRDSSISVPFSGDALVFSETMQDWRAHTGVDIPGEKGDAVKACAAGVVKEVSGEGLYGLTVVVSHGELTVSYCGLDTVSVKKGDSVPIGGTLGTLGTVPCEEKAVSYTHLDVYKRQGSSSSFTEKPPVPFIRSPGSPFIFCPLSSAFFCIF